MIEFLEEPHIYLWDGEIMPSVTEVVGKTVGAGTYKDVPASVLRKAAEYGTAVHEWCEAYLLWGEKKPVEGEFAVSAEQFVQLIERLQIACISTEQVVGYDHKVCGKFDLLAYKGESIVLADYKTTSRLHKDMVGWQLSIYAEAVEESLGMKVDEIACIWMPKKGDAKYVALPRRTKEEVDELIEQYLAEEA